VDIPELDECRRCEAGKYLVKPIHWADTDDSKTNEEVGPTNTVIWTARNVLYNIRDCGQGYGVACPLDISYKIFKDYPLSAYRGCTHASIDPRKNTCGKLEAAGTGRAADLPAGHDYLMVASHDGYFTSYFTFNVEPDGVNVFTLEMVEELSPREERQLLHHPSIYPLTVAGRAARPA
jgi:hypothetical protein